MGPASFRQDERLVSCPLGFVSWVMDGDQIYLGAWCPNEGPALCGSLSPYLTLSPVFGGEAVAHPIWAFFCMVFRLKNFKLLRSAVNCSRGFI